MKAAELKPCPFCGGAAEKKTWNAPGRSTAFVVACCSECGAMTWPYGDARNAILRWNRRTGEKAGATSSC